MSVFSQLKQIKDLRSQAKQMQTEMAEQVAEGSADWGKVKIKLDGNMQVLSVMIDDALIGNKEKIESGVKEAFGDAMKQIQKIMVEKMRASGTLPDLLKGE
ncbi:MAG: YbaB/EbfC family nucleoid-associated protein [bacterium]